MTLTKFIWVLAGCLPVSVWAQENHTHLKQDSLKAESGGAFEKGGFQASPVVEKHPGKDAGAKPAVVKWDEFKASPLPKIPYHVNPSPMFFGDYSTSGRINSYLYGSGSQTTMPGFGRMNEASLLFRYEIGSRFEFQAGLDATKFSFPLSTGQAFGVSGAWVYHFSDRLSFRAFGTYSPDAPYGLYMNTYGGTAMYDFTGRFGVEAGVRRYYSPLRNSWQTAPVVMPFYKMKRAKIGIDVGGILYGVLRKP